MININTYKMVAYANFKLAYDNLPQELKNEADNLMKDLVRGKLDCDAMNSTADILYEVIYN